MCGGVAGAVGTPMLWYMTSLSDLDHAPFYPKYNIYVPTIASRRHSPIYESGHMFGYFCYRRIMDGSRYKHSFVGAICYSCCIPQGIHLIFIRYFQSHKMSQRDTSTIMLASPPGTVHISRTITPHNSTSNIESITAVCFSND